MWVFFPWFFFLKASCCGYSFELHRHVNEKWSMRQVDAIQMGTHNICLYKEVDKKYTCCNLKTTELFDYALIGVCAVIRQNMILGLFDLTVKANVTTATESFLLFPKKQGLTFCAGNALEISSLFCQKKRKQYFRIMPAMILLYLFFIHFYRHFLWLFKEYIKKLWIFSSPWVWSVQGELLWSVSVCCLSLVFNILL